MYNINFCYEDINYFVLIFIDQKFYFEKLLYKQTVEKRLMDMSNTVNREEWVV